MTQPLGSDADFTGLLRRLADYLAGDVTPDDIAERLGGWATDETDEASLVPTEIRISSPYLRRAGIARYPGSDVPYAVTLVPTDDAQPTVADLRSTFGQPLAGAYHLDHPLELQFTTNAGGDWGIVLVVRAERRGPELEDAVVTRVLLRRDRRT